MKAGARTFFMLASIPPYSRSVRGLGSATAHAACPAQRGKSAPPFLGQRVGPVLKAARIAHGAIRVSDRVTLGALLSPS